MVPLAFQTAVDIINKRFPNEIASENENPLSKELFFPGVLKEPSVINSKEEKRRQERRLAALPGRGDRWAACYMGVIRPH